MVSYEHVHIVPASWNWQAHTCVLKHLRLYQRRQRLTSQGKHSPDFVLGTLRHCSKEWGRPHLLQASAQVLHHVGVAQLAQQAHLCSPVAPAASLSQTARRSIGGPRTSGVRSKGQLFDSYGSL